MTFLHPDTNENRFPIPIPIHKHMRHLHYVRVGCCNGAMLTPGFFHFFSINTVVQSIACSCRASYRVYRSRCTGKSVSPSPVFVAQLIAYRDAQFCMHLIVENKCVTSTCIYHSPRLCGTLSWSCVSLRLACGLFVFAYHQKI